MFDEGKITQKPVETIDGLNYTYEIIFVNEAGIMNIIMKLNENYNTRLEHCNANSISHSVEVGV